MIRLFARHRTAANLLMAAMLIAGLVAALRMNTQFFPDFGIDVISVSIEWPGAAAEDVDGTIVQAVEPAVRFLDNVKKVRSVSRRGKATVVVEFEPEADMQAALADVDAAVSRITTLPEDSETPRISRAVRYDEMVRLVLSGDLPERALKAWAKRLRDGLLDAGVDKVNLHGVRGEEILVEVDQPTLLALDLTVSEISRRIAASSQDLPSGDLGGESVIQVRSLGLARTAAEIAAMEIIARSDGRRIRLGDVARVREDFDEDGNRVYSRGMPAVEIAVMRASTADALDTAAVVEDYLEEVLPTLPPGLTVTRHRETTGLLRERINLLLRNGLGGLALVLIVLFLFLNVRSALWVAAGIPTALLAALAIGWAAGQTINMISLFGLILVLGMVVDGAIVVAEHAETQARRGLGALEAAVRGARRMAPPVFSSTLTTVAAFLPLLVIGDIIGQIIRAIPLIVVMALVAGLIECFLVLPGHMRHALSATGRAGVSRFRTRFDDGFRRFRETAFRRSVAWALARRYFVIALALAMLVVSVGLVAGGRVGFVFFPSVEGDLAFANLRTAPGTPRDETLERLAWVERAAYGAAERLGAPDLILVSTVSRGAGRGQGPGFNSSGDTVGAVTVELRSADKRDVRMDRFIRTWREEVGPLVGADAFTIRPARAGPPGREIDVRLSGNDLGTLKTAANRVASMLASYPGVSEIQDNLALGGREMRLKVTPEGRSLGFDTANVGRQVRDALEGSTAKRFARGDEEVRVRVRQTRDGAGLSGFYLRGPDGAETPLAAAVGMETVQGFDRILRERGAREVAITAEVDEETTSGPEVLAALERDGLFRLARDADLRVRYEGRALEQAETFADMRLGATIGLAGMVLVLAWVFASYGRPFAVLLAIPLGFIGVAWGHFLTGFDLTILSMIGMIGLSGIVVNDSIVLIVTVTERQRAGEPVLKAIENGTCDRLRAVILTSLTTIGGLLPICFETSLQAQFLIPMALTIAAGLVSATFLVLFVIPAALAVGADLSALFGGRRSPAPTSVPAG